MQNKIKRREILGTLGLGLLATQFSVSAHAKATPPLPAAKENSGEWKVWKIKYKITPGTPLSGVLIPLPAQLDTTYQKSLSLDVKGNFESAQILRHPSYRADALFASFAKGAKHPEVEATMTVQTRNRTASEPKLPSEDLSVYLKPTRHMPVDGLVLETANKITKGIKSTDQKALAFHNWIIDNTFRDPKVKGCGVGDINNMLATQNLGGKCADLNSLFVGLCRASGIPAREVFGLRVGESEQFKSIGKSGMISKAQHCRAEYFSPNKGWVAADPADVRKVILEENLQLGDPKVQAIRKKFFGFWEMNWIAFNSARDFSFSQADREMNFLMYPQSIGGEIDSLDPDQFKYSIETVS